MQQPITLYLDLEKGTSPDLATVARAALAFDAAVKEVAFVLDPSLTVRLELESGTAGSLKLNSLIKSLRDKATDPTILKTVALVVLGWFANDIRSYTVEQFIENVIREETQHELSDDEIKRIAEEVAKALKGEVGEKQIKKVYEELQRDETIKGVGVTTNPDKKPRIIVPRAEFHERGGATYTADEPSHTRRSTKVETVTLISPVLLPNQRKWRFSLNGFEFGASVKDLDFLERLLNGREPVPMAAGITMEVALETKEENVDGVWTVKERNVLDVLATHPAQRQSSLNLTPSKDSDDGGKQQ